MKSDLVGYKVASEILGLPLGTLYAKVCKGEIEHHRLGPRLVRFSRRALVGVLAQSLVDGRALSVPSCGAPADVQTQTAMKESPVG